jgi:Mn2+/Fe2+ NRAMP family transporter
MFFKAAGPGIVTGAADDDPSGIGTYSQAGAQFGFTFLWAAIVTWPLMAAVQMACARVGMITGEGLASAFEKKVPKFILILFCAALFIANTLNVAADLLAMSDGASMLGAGSSHLWVVIFGIGIAIATVKLRYQTIAKVLQWLALVLLSYVATAFIVEVDWNEALHATFIPHVPHGPKEWSMLVAILGTTISPYLFFWQTAEEVEIQRSEGRQTCTADDLFMRRVDIGFGTFLSNIVMFFIILTTAATLHKHGITNIETSKQAAEALKPIAGSSAYLLYTIGLIGTGLLAIPTLTGSAAYALAETFGWDEGLDAEWGKAKAFYSVIIASTVIAIAADFSHVNPIKALYGSAVVNGVVAPFLLLVLFLVVRDPKIMKGRPASKLMQLVLLICTLFMFGSLIALFIF